MGGKAKAKARKADRKQEKKAAKKALRPAPERASGGLLPRNLAGLEVPQALRQGGSALVEFATSDLGRAVLVAALTGAAEAILRHRPTGGEATSERGEAHGASVTAKDVVQSAALAAVGAVSRAVAPSAGKASASGAGDSEAGRSEEGQHGSDGTERGGRPQG